MGYRKLSGKTRGVTVFDIAVLLLNLYRGASDQSVGWEDAHNTLTDMHLALNRYVSLQDEKVESCLWSCNLLNERGKFVHPKGFTFDEFLKKILKKGETFNKDLNCFEQKETLSA